MNKKVRNSLLITLCILCSSLVAGTLYLFNYALKSDPSSRNISESYQYLFEKEPGLRTWVDSLYRAEALKDTFIYFNGERLHAIYLKAPVPTDKTALLLHGYTDNAVRMLMIGSLYNKELGYNILLPDLSGHGLSSGNWIQMGWKYRSEVMAWIDIALELFGNESQIVIHGISMGASTAMMTAGETLPGQVKCFVADCGYTDVWSQFKYQLKRDFSLPAFPLMQTASAYCNYRLGWNFKEASALKQVEKCEKPIFFIHGDSDTYVPTSMVYELYDAKKKGEKELWVVPGVKHADAYWDYPEEYTERVKDFVDKYINKL